MDTRVSSLSIIIKARMKKKKKKSRGWKVELRVQARGLATVKIGFAVKSNQFGNSLIAESHELSGAAAKARLSTQFPAV